MYQRTLIFNLAIFVSIAASCVAAWAWFNRPMDAPDWPERVSGYSYSPFRQGQDPTRNIFPTEEQIRADIELLSEHTNRLRTYSVKGTLGDIPRIAQDFGINITLGIWISNDPVANEDEINRAIQIANSVHNIDLIIVGNEALFRTEVTPEEMINYIERVRASVKVRVTTAEPWHIWLKYPELASHVKVIGAHVLLFWEKVPPKKAVKVTIERARELRKAFPKKRLLIAEVGWPSHGRPQGEAEATPAVQAVYLRTMLDKLNSGGYEYFVIEAFDQTWKTRDEGDVGAYWGVYDVERRPKFPFSGPVVAIPEWRTLAGVSVVLAVLSFALLLIDSSGLKRRGRTFLALIAFGMASFLVFVAYDYSRQYLGWLEWSLGAVLVLSALGVFTVLFAEAHEMAETIWAERRRPFKPVLELGNYLPKVSIHVPCYNEPPEMLKLTLDALAVLDYPHFEVLVIDNNTPDESAWRPVEAHCAALGPRFRFFHVSPLAGFKAGALNYALERTAPDAEVVAVIDADYIVLPNWLTSLVPHFADPRIGVVQGPQDYRDGGESLFKRLCYAEYKGFFHIGMITRNDRDAIIQHGTMTMIRRPLLDQLRWGDWTITEDAELGLRVFAAGFSAAYVPDSVGQGVMPDRFIDYKKQRFRWAFGAMQIMRRHARMLFSGEGSQLTRGQRYHFLAGWLPWFADGLNLFFTAGALVWTAAILIAPTQAMPPDLMFAIPPLMLFVGKLSKILYLYIRHMRVPLATSLGAAIAGLALSHTIGKAVAFGMVTRAIPFFRTPKLATHGGAWQAVAEAREELYVMLLLWGGAIGMVLLHHLDTTDAWAWLLMLLVQSLPYLAAVLMSWMAVLARPREAATDVPAVA
jgi:exo-beta-1,3-glucanase (GH17 family)/cellulose synthase/poly-beta-1,6-N-acetylglucosamine synthase-like glycosyltransferase